MALGLLLTKTLALAATVDVAIGDSFFNPTPLTINAGDTVRWTNNGSFPHTTTSGTGCSPDGNWDSASLSTGQTFSHTFNTAGTFPYYCTFHCGSGMVGEITVNAPPPPFTPLIAANNTRTALTIGKSDPLIITASLDAGTSAGINADWWVVAETPVGYYHLVLETNPWQWEQGLIVTYQGPLTNIPETVILNGALLPPGTYTVYFGMDTVVDGVVTFDHATYDHVVVTINP
jgi:plastocyanin